MLPPTKLKGERASRDYEYRGSSPPCITESELSQDLDIKAFSSTLHSLHTHPVLPFHPSGPERKRGNGHPQLLLLILHPVRNSPSFPMCADRDKEHTGQVFM